MKDEKLLIGNPHSEKDMSLVNDFQKRHQITVAPVTANFLSNAPKEQELKESLYLIHKEQIIDSCYIEGNKDTKMCTLTFPKLTPPLENRRLLMLATDYALNTKQMEEVFIFVPLEDKKMANAVTKLGYESLETEADYHLFVKDKQVELESKEVHQWNL